MRFMKAVIAAACLSLSVLSAASASPVIEAGFSPSTGQQSALALVVSGINGAQRQVLVAAYSFTSKPIATALINAKLRGVDVRVVADMKSNSAHYSAVTFLANKGVPVRLNGRYAIMHNKFMVIDSQDVQTGSFNYTQAAAQKNAENVLVLREVPDLAATYTQNFERLWDEGEVLSPGY